MPALSALPNELLARIVSFIDKPALAHTRLVNRRFEQLTVEKLFERVSLYAHWRKEDEEEETYSVDSVRGGLGGCREGDGCVRCDMRRLAGGRGGERGMGDDGEGELVDHGLEVDRDAILISGEESSESRVDGAERLEDFRSLGLFRRESFNGRRGLDARSSMNAYGSLQDGNDKIEEDDPSWYDAFDEQSNARKRQEGETGRMGLWAEGDDEQEGNGEVRQREHRDEESSAISDMSDERESPSIREERGSSHQMVAQGYSRSDSGQSTAEESQLELSERPNRKTHPWDRMTPQWALDGLPGPPGYNANRFKNILQHENLKRYVKEVQVYTCETHCDHHPAYESTWFIEDFPSANFDPVYHECIKRLDEFPNLRRITVHFDRHAGNEDDIFQKKDFQRVWLRRILRSIKHFMPELAVRHYQNSANADEEAPLFVQCAANVTSLRMSIKHEETSHGAGPTYRCGNIHNFWNRFPDRFLSPPQANLTTLVLYSDLPLGWFPKLDLRGIHFPNLHSLTLGHHIFHHEHQIDWIISHEATLKNLYLDRCSILYQIGRSIPGWLDEDGYPRANPPGSPSGDTYGWSSSPEYIDDVQQFSSDLQLTSLSLRWHDVFSRFANELPNLRIFKFGSSKQWEMDTASRYIEQGYRSHALPIMPWEDEENIETRVFEERYVVWDDWEQDYRPNWRSRTVTGVWEEMDKNWREEWKAGLELYPDCEEEDEDALRDLLNRNK